MLSDQERETILSMMSISCIFSCCIILCPLLPCVLSCISCISAVVLIYDFWARQKKSTCSSFQDTYAEIMNMNDVTKKKEHTLCERIGKDIAKATIKYNEYINYNSKRYFIDIVLEFPTIRICIECDEHEHKSSNYSADENRMIHINTILTDKKNIWFRWNPDNYKHNGTCIDLDNRYDILCRYIKNKKLLKYEVYYFFYSKTNKNIGNKMTKYMVYV